VHSTRARGHYLTALPARYFGLWPTPSPAEVTTGYRYANTIVLLGITGAAVQYSTLTVPTGIAVPRAVLYLKHKHLP
jgi:hypothetical protein